MNRPLVFKRGLIVTGLCFLAFQLWPSRERILAGRNDFLCRYAGAVLAGTDHLYDPEATRKVEETRADMWGESVGFFVWPPFYAALLSPLRFLPYRAAYLVWELISIAALLAFLWLWSAPGREWMPAACAWSLPISVAIANGQDLTMLLLCVGLAIRWSESSPKMAGAVLALCSIKFHLFLMIPVVLLVQRRRAMLAGGAWGMAALMALSFLVAGPGWPARYVTALRSPDMYPAPQLLVSLYGLSQRWGAGLWLPALLSAVVIAGLVLVARRVSLAEAVALALVCGPLLGAHAHIHDAALLLPGLVAVASRFSNWVGLLAIGLLSPLPYAWLLSGSPLSTSIQIGCLALLAAVLYYSSRQRQNQEHVAAAQTGSP